MKSDDLYLQAAIQQAMRNLREGKLYGQPRLPIGSALAVDGVLVALGRNQRVQAGDATAHAEMDCLRQAGRLSSRDYQRATLYTSLFPCRMCGGTVTMLGIGRVVVADPGEDIERSETWKTPIEWFDQRGITVETILDKSMRQAFRQFVRDYPEVWNEDVAG